MARLLGSSGIRGKLLVAFSLASFATSAAFTAYAYFAQRESILDGIDRRLRVAALSVPALLPDGLHERPLGPGGVPAAEHTASVGRLTAFASGAGVAYVYSLVKVDGQLYFTSTSASPEETREGKEPPFFQHYQEPSAAVVRLFEGGDAVVETATDEFGDFRSVLLPVARASGGRYVVGADVYTSEIEATLGRTLVHCVAIGLAFFAAALAAGVVLSGRITAPLVGLARHTDQLAAKNFAVDEAAAADLGSIAARNDDEVGHLARSFDRMTRTLAAYLVDLQATTAAKERIESELKIAHDIQMSFLPKLFPPFPDRPEVDLYAGLEPAREVGGDLYDYCLLDEEHLFFYVGDVSDKGVPAALLMAVTMAVMKRRAQQVGVRPDEILALVNRDLAAGNENLLFVTAFCAILNLRTGRVHYSNAGHNPPLVVRADGRVEWLKLPVGMVLAVAPDSPYQTLDLTLGRGDTLLLYTDGVTEAMDVSRRLYSEARLHETVERAGGASVTALVREVFDSVRRHAAGAPQSDDITVLALQYRGL